MNPNSNSNSNSTMLGIVVVIVIVVGIVSYWWFAMGGAGVSFMPGNGDVKDLQKQSSSDEVASIEADLNDTTLNDLDKEVTDIEKELAAPSPSPVPTTK
ncbi:hypothetical protein HYT01_04075 [Candidatus Giovannonibacteria bacterium]|nr:hypothetical protein [Candidatus Giovannonibacteria bacterium]